MMLQCASAALSVVFVLGVPLQKYNKGSTSNLQLLVPVQPLKPASSVPLATTLDEPFSSIPAEQFTLDDRPPGGPIPNRTVKKDLSSYVYAGPSVVGMLGGHFRGILPLGLGKNAVFHAHGKGGLTLNSGVNGKGYYALNSEVKNLVTQGEGNKIYKGFGVGNLDLVGLGGYAVKALSKAKTFAGNVGGNGQGGASGNAGLHASGFTTGNVGFNGIGALSKNLAINMGTSGLTYNNGVSGQGHLSGVNGLYNQGLYSGRYGVNNLIASHLSELSGVHNVLASQGLHSGSSSASNIFTTKGYPMVLSLDNPLLSQGYHSGSTGVNNVLASQGYLSGSLGVKNVLADQGHISSSSVLNKDLTSQGHQSSLLGVNDALANQGKYSSSSNLNNVLSSQEKHYENTGVNNELVSKVQLFGSSNINDGLVPHSGTTVLKDDSVNEGFAVKSSSVDNGQLSVDSASNNVLVDHNGHFSENLAANENADQENYSGGTDVSSDLVIQGSATESSGVDIPISQGYEIADENNNFISQGLLSENSHLDNNLQSQGYVIGSLNIDNFLANQGFGYTGTDFINQGSLTQNPELKSVLASHESFSGSSHLDNASKGHVSGGLDVNGVTSGQGLQSGKLGVDSVSSNEGHLESNLDVDSYLASSGQQSENLNVDNFLSKEGYLSGSLSHDSVLSNKEFESAGVNNAIVSQGLLSGSSHLDNSLAGQWQLVGSSSADNAVASQGLSLGSQSVSNSFGAQGHISGVLDGNNGFLSQVTNGQVGYTGNLGLNEVGSLTEDLGVKGQGGVAGHAALYGQGTAAGNVGLHGTGWHAGSLGGGKKKGLYGSLGIGGIGTFYEDVGEGSNNLISSGNKLKNIISLHTTTLTQKKASAPAVPQHAGHASYSKESPLGQKQIVGGTAVAVEQDLIVVTPGENNNNLVTLAYGSDKLAPKVSKVQEQNDKAERNVDEYSGDKMVGDQPTARNVVNKQGQGYVASALAAQGQGGPPVPRARCGSCLHLLITGLPATSAAAPVVTHRSNLSGAVTLQLSKKPVSPSPPAKPNDTLAKFRPMGGRRD